MERRLAVPNLFGVPETMLWPLYNRAAEARRPDAFLKDSMGVRIADGIEYDYTRSFGKPDPGHAIRAVVFDQLPDGFRVVDPASVQALDVQQIPDHFRVVVGMPRETNMLHSLFEAGSSVAHGR